MDINENQRQFICPSCNKQLKKPKLLKPCRHTLCGECCAALLAGTGKLTCVVCKNETLKTDIRTDFNKQREMDILNKNHHKELMNIYHKYIKFKKSFDEALSVLELSRCSLTNIEHAILKQINSSEEALIDYVVGSHERLRQQLHETLETHRHSFESQAPKIEEMKLQVKTTFDGIEKSLLKDRGSVDFNHSVMTDATQFLEHTSALYLAQVQQAVVSVNLRYVGVDEPYTFLDDLELFVGTGQNSSKWGERDSRDDVSDDVDDKNSSLDESKWEIEGERVDLDQTVRALAETMAPIQDKLKLVDLDATAPDQVQTNWLQEYTKEQHLSLTEVCTVPAGVADMAVICGEIWLVMEEGYIVCPAQGTSPEKRISMSVNAADVTLNYPISSVVQMSSGQIVLSCRGVSASRPVSACACLAIQEVDASGRHVESIDNDDYVQRLACCENSLFALLVDDRNNGHSTVRWLRYTGDEWIRVGNISIGQERLAISSIVALSHFLCFTIATLSFELRAIDLSDYFSLLAMTDSDRLGSETPVKSVLVTEKPAASLACSLNDNTLLFVSRDKQALSTRLERLKDARTQLDLIAFITKENVLIKASNERLFVCCLDQNKLFDISPLK